MMQHSPYIKAHGKNSVPCKALRLAQCRRSGRVSSGRGVHPGYRQCQQCPPVLLNGASSILRTVSPFSEDNDKNTVTPHWRAMPRPVPRRWPVVTQGTAPVRWALPKKAIQLR